MTEEEHDWRLPLLRFFSPPQLILDRHADKGSELVRAHDGFDPTNGVGRQAHCCLFQAERRTSHRLMPIGSQNSFQPYHGAKSEIIDITDIAYL